MPAFTLEQIRNVKALAASRTADATTVGANVVAWVPRASHHDAERTVYDVFLNGVKVYGGRLGAVESFGLYTNIVTGLKAVTN